MKISVTITTLAIFASTALFADEGDVASQTNDLIRFGKKMVTREYAKNALARAQAKRTGGYVRKPGSAKGYFVLLDAQKVVSARDYASAIETIDKQTHVQMKTVTLEVLPIESIRSEVGKAGGNVGVALIADPTLPALLAAPEEGWGLVNVAKLADADKSKVAARTRREILRALALAGGVMYAAQGDFVLQPVREPSELDKLTREQYGAAMAYIFKLSLPYYGISPAYQATYKKACEEGWAPSPTNDAQKAIWDKVYAIPQKPIKIEYDEKRDKGK